MKTPTSKRGGGATLPAFVEPCLAMLVSDPPMSEQWVHEIKFDGYRMQARIEQGQVQLLTRSGRDWTPKFQTLAEALQALNVTSALIDGEVVVEDDHGVSSFVELVKDLKANRSERMVYFAFDLLFHDNTDTRALCLEDRKALLKRTLGRTKPGAKLRYSEHMTGDSQTILAHACKLGLEGIISKRLDRPYRSGRHDDWLKAKCIQTDEFVIAGYLDSSAVANAIGALVVGFYEGRDFIYAGRVGTGFSRRTAAELWQAMQTLKRPNPDFKLPLDRLQAKAVVWVKPKLVAQVEYRAWTADGLLRHAAFKALREDKPAVNVTRPTVIKPSEQA